MSIAIVTDTACNLTPEQAKELGIYVLPIEIIIDNVTYKDGIDITNEEFYEKMAVAKSVPKTSQPTMGDALALYQELSKAYDEILSIHLGSNLSGAVQSLELLARDATDLNVTVYDTQLVSIPAAYLVFEAKRLVDEGKNIAEITQHLDQLRHKSIAFAAVHSMDVLVESGRVPSVVGTVAKIAKVKPILSIKASETKGLDVIEKVRTSKRANNRLLDLVEEYTATLDYPFCLDVAHGKMPAEAEELRNELQKRYPNQEINIHLLTSVIGAHSGSDIVGIFVAPK